MNDAPQQKGRKRLWPLAVLAASLYAFITFNYQLFQRWQFGRLENKYIRTVVSKPDYGMCSPAASELEQWCRENYFGVKGFALRATDEIFSIEYPDIKFACEIARHNKVFYQRHIQRFLHQLDQDQVLRQGLEKKVYDLEREIMIDICRNSGEIGNYTVSFLEDESDQLYRENFSLLRNDEILQQLFRDITTGNILAAEQYQERVEEIIESAPFRSDLEEIVQENILEEFRGGDAYKLLVTMAKHSLAGIKLNEAYVEREKALNQIISENQELKIKYEQIVSLLGERQYLLDNKGRFKEAQVYKQQKKMQQLELENLTKEISDDTKELKEVRHQKKNLTEELGESFQKEPERLWQSLGADLIDTSVFQIRTYKETIDSTIIAEGHTHPYALAIKVLKSGLSSNDQKASFRKPELVFEGHKDTWRVYSALCGEVALEREYPRTTINNLLQKPF